ncbi:MAG: AIR synthase-related protein, partial [Sandaracinaceae bacterium]
SRGALGGSELWVWRTGYVGGEPVGIDLAAEVQLQAALRSLAKRRLLASGHDLSDGGFAIALAEMSIASGLGCQVRLPGDPEIATVARLFSEEPTRVLVSFDPERALEVADVCESHGVPLTTLGEVGGTDLVIEGALSVPVDELSRLHHGCLDAILERG